MTTLVAVKMCAVDDCGARSRALGYCTKHYQRVKKYGDPNIARDPATSGGQDDTLSLWGLRTRFVEKIAFEPMSGCWFWLGVTDACGYGCIRVDGRFWGTHRYAYETIIGPVPDGLEIDHLCQVRNCVNPAHMEPVTQEENKRRAGLRRTMCASGNHPRFPGSRYGKGTNAGRCKECVRAASRRYSLKNQMAAAPIREAA